MMNATINKPIPREAFRFEAATCELSAAKDGGNIPIRIKARSGQPLTHWYWGRIVHDMAGMRTPGPSIPLDYVHDDKEILGYADKFEAGGDLVISGELIPFKDGDRVREIKHKSENGVPYQASIFWDGDTHVLEDIPAGESVQVNGYEFSGPGVVVRKWLLRGVAVCPYGYDANTSSELAGVEKFDYQSFHERETMSKKKLNAEETPATPAEETPEEKVVETDPKEEAPAAEKPAEETPEETPAEPTEQASPGQKFLEAFGDKGAVWFVQGKSFEEAAKLHNEAMQKEIAELKQKLGAVEWGLKKPASFTPGDEDKDKAASKNDATPKDKNAEFAAAFPLPGKK
jgi:hypothetical protein